LARTVLSEPPSVNWEVKAGVNVTSNRGSRVEVGRRGKAKGNEEAQLRAFRAPVADEFV
jgi:hypothetical protein